MNQTQLGSFESIPLSAIRPSTTNPRKHFDPIALEELTRSVNEMGVTNPLLLRPLYFEPTGLATDEGTYEIVSGERRYRAAVAAGRDAVPAIVKEIDDNEALDLQMIENLQRADLHPMEEAEGYRVLESHGATPEDIAKRSGKTLSQVIQTMRLLSLSLYAQVMFRAGHLTLGHARLLARLTVENQDLALCYLLDISPYQVNKTQTESYWIKKAIASREAPAIDPGDEEDGRADWKRKEYERKSKLRMVNRTEGELKDWIESHVLLQLANVPWHLADADLVPAAGPCTTCPKRTGANVALFQDLTTAEDTCTDPTCFATKQTAQLNRQKDAAKATGAALLKISSKRSNEKLEEKAVEVRKGSTTVTKKTVKEGQWVPSEEGACAGTVQALMQDGPDKGKLAWVCADQKCKEHKHTVNAANTGYSSERSQKQQAEQEEKRADLVTCELKIRAALLAEARAGVTPNAATLREAILDIMAKQRFRNAMPIVAYACGITVPAFPPGGYGPTESYYQQCIEAVRAKVGSMTSISSLVMVLFDLSLGELLEPVVWRSDDEKDRKRAYGLVAEYGVDGDKAAAIAERVTAEHNAPKLELQIQAAAQPAAKDGKKKISAAEQAKRKASAAKKFPNTVKKQATKAVAEAGA